MEIFFPVNPFFCSAKYTVDPETFVTVAVYTDSSVLTKDGTASIALSPRLSCTSHMNNGLSLTLQKIFSRKMFPMKILYNESFPIYGSKLATRLYVTQPITWMNTCSPLNMCSPVWNVFCFKIQRLKFIAKD